MTPNGWIPLGPSCIFNGQVGYDTNGVAPVAGRCSAIAVDPTKPDTDIYIGTAGGGVWKTTDGGLNWKPKTDDQICLAVGAIAINLLNTQNVWVATGEGDDTGADAFFGRGLLVSDNGGDTWT